MAFPTSLQHAIRIHTFSPALAFSILTLCVHRQKRPLLLVAATVGWSLSTFFLYLYTHAHALLIWQPVVAAILAHDKVMVTLYV